MRLQNAAPRDARASLPPPRCRKRIVPRCCCCSRCRSACWRPSSVERAPRLHALPENGQSKRQTKSRRGRKKNLKRNEGGKLQTSGRTPNVGKACLLLFSKPIAYESTEQRSKPTAPFRRPRGIGKRKRRCAAALQCLRETALLPRASLPRHSCRGSHPCYSVSKLALESS